MLLDCLEETQGSVRRRSEGPRWSSWFSCGTFNYHIQTVDHVAVIDPPCLDTSLASGFQSDTLSQWEPSGNPVGTQWDTVRSTSRMTSHWRFSPRRFQSLWGFLLRWIDTSAPLLESKRRSSVWKKQQLPGNSSSFKHCSLGWNFSQLIAAPSVVTGENKSNLFNGKDGDTVKN